MFRLVKIFIILLIPSIFSFSATGYAPQYADEAKTLPLRWKNNTINIALSTSLIKQFENAKPDIDIPAVIRRSFASWEKAANVKFALTITDKQSGSPAGNSGDGISLITIAPTAENLTLFAGDANDTSARTRIFFNRKGFITEADIVLNPYQQFSSDGSFETFDFEATLTHEIGHLLGLDHSSIIGSTMQAHQGKNGIYGLPAFSSRTLAEDDVAGIRALYGAKSSEESCCSSLNGKITIRNVTPANVFQVWAEDLATGRVAAGTLTNSDGSFRLDGLSGGKYRIYAQDFAEKSKNKKFFSVEQIGKVSLEKGKIINLAKSLSGKLKSFDVNFAGFNGQLSKLTVPVNGGKSFMVFLGGDNLNLNDLKISFNSPFLSVVPNSYLSHDFGDALSVISFEVAVSSSILPGEYSIQAQKQNGETAILAGGISVDEIVNPWNITTTGGEE